jgi:small subunit ribosomal protein S10
MYNISLKQPQIELQIRLKSFHYKIFKLSLLKILEKINYLNINSSKIIPLPIKLKRFTVLRSPHIDKKSREQFEIKTFNRLLVIKYNPLNIDEKYKINFLINFIKNSCAGIQIKINFIN